MAPRHTGSRDTGSVLNEPRLRNIAEDLTQVEGIVGVVLGGSRARGDHTPDSDVDLGLYYRPPLDLPELRNLARRLAGPRATLTVPGGWGPWVNGGGWLRVDDTSVDWLYRDLDRVHECWAAARSGRYTFHAQAGHPLGVPDFAYPGELALGVVLADPTGELDGLQHRTRRFPSALGKALIAGLWEADFMLQIAEKAVARADTAYVAGCLFRAVLLCAHALHGHAGRWLINEKGAVAATGRLPGAPDDFAERAHHVLTVLGREPGHLTAALRLASELLDDTRQTCQLLQ